MVSRPRIPRVEPAKISIQRVIQKAPSQKQPRLVVKTEKIRFQSPYFQEKLSNRRLNLDELLKEADSLRGNRCLTSGISEASEGTPKVRFSLTLGVRQNSGVA